jgi:16S rRNA (guanine966-N2)-methyltransferase
MSVRILGGERRGAILRTPAGTATRPTLGRVRASLLTILAPTLSGARVLDAFAGCGALGLESLSRGAVHATFLEQAARALETLRLNIAKLRYEDRARVLGGDALVHLKRPAPPGGEPFDLLLLDPPYGRGLAARALALLGERADAWLAAEGWVVVQAGRRDPLDEAHGALRRFREQCYSETRVAFYRSGD